MLESVWATISWHYGLEALLFGTCLYLFFRRRNSSKPEFVLTEKQKDELIAEWEPEPLVPDTPEDHPLLNPRYVDGKVTKNVKIDGKDYLNMATTNFLSFVGDERIEDVAKKTIFKYGVGSCGPRGFYGTVDVHLDLEKDLAKFFGLEEAVLYSYGFATVASAIPAYAKKGDIIYVDKGVNFAVQKGLQASRAKVEWFEHNDVKHLEQLLAAQAEKDKKEPKKAATSRRFIVVEGLYANSADLCPLPQLIDLKWKYKVRIFIDESYSVGVIGKTGRGVTEHFGVDVIDVDMIMGSLENALASTGGFCVGRSYVVGHQRLSGLGYCFSASLPPLLATAAGQALNIIDEEPERILRVQEKSKKLQKGLREAAANTPFVIVGASEAPFVHVQYKGDDAEEKLDDLVERLFQSGVVVTRARYIDREEAFPIPPSVRILCQADLSEEEIQKTIEAFRSAVQDIH